MNKLFYENRKRKTARKSAIRDGFTLIELLVVIAIIAILAGILLPVLAKAKERAKMIECLNNMKELQTAYLMYVHDNNDSLPLNAIGGANSWITNGAEQVNVLIEGIQAGALYQYNQNAKIYQCPANTVTHHPQNGTDALKARLEYHNSGITVSSQIPQVRTCSINYPLGGFHAGSDTLLNGALRLDKYSGIRSPNPGPAQMFVFCDENEYSIDDGCFAIDPTGSGNYRWWNLPGSRHNHGTTWSFADGHCEYWRWHGTCVLTFKSYYQTLPTPNTPGDLDDLSRVQACTCPLAP